MPPHRRIQSLIVLTLILVSSLHFSSSSPIGIQIASAAPSNQLLVRANIIGKNIVFLGESVQIGVYAKALSVTLTIIAPNESTVYSNMLTANTTINFTPTAIYGTYRVDASVSGVTTETWFCLQDTTGLTSQTLPYTWTWKNVQYTLGSDYVVTAKINDKQLTVNWLPNFLSLNPTVTVTRNGANLNVRMVRSGRTVNYWIMNTCFGVNFRIVGSVAAGMTLFIPVTSSSGSWKTSLNQIRVPASTCNLIYDWSDVLTRSTGCTFSQADVVNGRLVVAIGTSFDIEDQIFTDGFEDGTTNAWTYDDGITIENTITHHSSLHSAKTNALKNIGYTLAGAQSDLYLRSYVYFATLPTSGQVIYFNGIEQGGYTTYIIGDLEFDGGTLKWGLDINGVTTFDSVGVTPQAATWTCIEMRMKAGTGNGIAQMWVEGTKIVDVTTATFGSATSIMGCTWSNDAGIICYFDCYITDTAYIGPEAGGPAEDYVDNNTSNVAAPTNIGTSSSFTAQKATDGSNDTLTEADNDAGTSTWGKTSGSGSSYRTTAANEVRLGVFTATSTGEVASIVFYGRGSSSTHAKAIITDSSGNLLTNGVGDAVTVSTTAGTKTLTYTVGSRPIVTNGTTYWIGMIWQAAGRVYYDSTTGATSKQDLTNSYTTPTNPSDAGGTTETWRLMYANVNNLNYRLDIEEQFTNVNYTRTNEELCILTGPFNGGATEALKLYWWNATGSAWVLLDAALDASAWNNYTVPLTAATFTINFVDATQTTDTVANTWKIDACLLHTWEVTNHAPTNDACDSTATFDYDTYGWVNVTVTDTDLVANLYTVSILVTTSDSKTSNYTWTQSTNTFAETADASGISSINGGSVRVNVDADTDKIAFSIKFTQVPALGDCSVRAFTFDDSYASDTDTYAAEFRLIFSYKTASKALTFTKSTVRAIEMNYASSKSIALTSSTAKLLAATRVTTQSLTLTDAAAKLLTWARGVTESLTLAKAATKLIEFTKAASKTLTLANAAARLTEFTRVATQAVTGAFSAARILEYTRAAAQTIAGAFAATKLLEAARAATQGLTLGIAASQLSEFIRAATQSITGAFSATRMLEYTRAAAQAITGAFSTSRLAEIASSATQSLTIVSSVARAIEVTLGATQGITLTSSVARLGEFLRSATQGVTLSNAATRLAELLGDVSQSLILTNSAASILEILRGITQSLTLTNAASRLAEMIRTATQDVTFSNSVSKLLEWARVATATFTLAPNVTPLLEFLKAASQVLTLSNAADRLAEFTRAATQGLTWAGSAIGEYIAGVQSYLRDASVALTLTNAATRLAEFLRDTTQGLTLGNAAMRLGEWLRDTTQGLTVANAASKLFEITRSATQTLVITNAATRLIDVLKAVSQDIDFAGTTTRLGEMLRAATQGLNLSNTASKLFEIIRVATQNLVLNGAAAKLFEITRNAVQGLNLSSVASRFIEVLKSASQALTLVNAAQTINEWLRVATQDLTLSILTDRLIEATRTASQTINWLGSAIGEILHSFVRAASQTLNIDANAARLIEMLFNVSQNITLTISTIGHLLTTYIINVTQTIRLYINGLPFDITNIYTPAMLEELNGNATYYILGVAFFCIMIIMVFSRRG